MTICGQNQHFQGLASKHSIAFAPSYSQREIWLLNIVTKHEKGIDMKGTNVGVVHIDVIEESFFDEFVATVDQMEVGLDLKKMPKPGPFACAEWFIPTTIAVFLGKPYFESFLKEVAKDHYEFLKKGISELCDKTIKTRRFEPTLYSSAGKKNNDNPYTLSFSVIAETASGFTFKLLLPKLCDEFEYQKATDAFLDFMADYYSAGELSQAYEIIKMNGRHRGQILVKYNQDTSKIEWQDDLPPKVRESMLK
ncbi:hypothetical protein [Planctobacterium marinum]|uniref:hypothetical protein n=1 Tax=Planctobacterium marinum TaxID=1631968 RepID=UPI001E4A3782|nr:hypothetical protein [Planctobacterium marinum]MCC2604418.1 hypothetical protein [Planctobacterium marinum]